MRRTLKDKPGEPGGSGDLPSMRRIAARLLVSTSVAASGSALLAASDLSGGRNSREAAKRSPRAQVGEQEWATTAVVMVSALAELIPE
jgi:hypothetical protein